MHKTFFYKNNLAIIIAAFACFVGNAQSKKDVKWNANGLTSKNYRLIHSPKNAGDIKIGAETASKPKMEGVVEIINAKRILKITLDNRFDYKNSWMLKSERHNAALLKHEQGHFDLNEIYTRKTFQRLKDFKFTNNFKKEIDTIMQAMNLQLRQEQQLYEDETIHGISTINQLKWNKEIESNLAEMPSYQDQAIEQEIPHD